MDAQLRLIELGTAIADGTPVDWNAAESQAVAPSEREIVRHLRLVERIAQAHASLLPAGSIPPLHDSLLHPSSGAPPSSDAPVTWGPLTILEKIGRGTFGDVYRARDSIDRSPSS